MAKLTKTAVFELMDEFAAVEAKIAKADAAKNRELDPLLAAHNDACRPVLERFEKKTMPLIDRREAIVAEVSGYLEQQGKDQIIRSQSGAVAEQKTETKIGSRVIDIEKFMKAAKSKGAAMWGCLSVAVAKAEKLIGKEAIDEISDKKETTSVVRTLRLEK